jgi:hypothetical protein
VVNVSLRTFIRPFLVSGCMLLLSSVLQYAGPLLLHRLVTFMASTDTLAPEPVSAGVSLCLLLGLARCCQSMADHQYAFRSKILGLQLRAAMQAAVYRKVRTALITRSRPLVCLRSSDQKINARPPPPRPFFVWATLTKQGLVWASCRLCASVTPRSSSTPPATW